MAAARIPAFTFGQYPPILRSTRGMIAAADDWMILPEWGGDVLAVYGQAGSPLGWAHPYVSVNLAAGYDADDVSIAFDGLTVGHLGTDAELARNPSFYLEVETTGELLQVRRVAVDEAGTAGTFALSRGALGTTPAAIPDDAKLYIKKGVVFTDVAVADQMAVVHYIPMSNDAGGARYA